MGLRRRSQADARAESIRSAGPSFGLQPGLSSAIPSAAEVGWASALLVLMLLLRLVNVFTFRFDSDEPQHLHVVWSWTRGLVQYRDTFDNHTPLFHLVMAPLAALAGERASILYLARLAMLPLFAAILALTWLIARRLYSTRVALWSTVVLSLFSIFFHRTLEFRTDSLWATLWLLGLLLLVRARLTPGSLLGAGAAIGAGLAVSLKTSLLLFALLVAGLLLLYLRRPPPGSIEWRRPLAGAAAFLAGLALVPVAIVVLFAWLGALRPLWYGTVQHNLVPHLGSWLESWKRVLFPLGLALFAGLAERSLRGRATEELGSRRLFLGLFTFSYALGLLTLWPLVTSQDFLPVLPTAITLLVSATIGLADRARSVPGEPGSGRRRTTQVLLLLAAVELGYMAVRTTFWRNETRQEVRLLSAVLHLTDPADAVMDLKGETLFRRRPFFYVLETITRRKLAAGLIRDTIAADMLANRCAVAVLDDPHFPPAGRAFLNASYVPVGPLRVAGTLLEVTGPRGAAIGFDIWLPARYAVVARSGPASGLLDGTPGTATRFLSAGHHEFTPSGDQGPLAVVWARAVERGFSPFSAERVAR